MVNKPTSKTTALTDKTVFEHGDLAQRVEIVQLMLAKHNNDSQRVAALLEIPLQMVLHLGVVSRMDKRIRAEMYHHPDDPAGIIERHQGYIYDPQIRAIRALLKTATEETLEKKS